MSQDSDLDIEVEFNPSSGVESLLIFPTLCARVPGHVLVPYGGRRPDQVLPTSDGRSVSETNSLEMSDLVTVVTILPREGSWSLPVPLFRCKEGGLGVSY